MGCSMHHPAMTVKGTTKRAICVDEPKATARAKSILSLYAQVIAVACSAALPTIGSSTTPTNALDSFHFLVTSSIVPTKNSEHTATARVTTASTMSAQHADISLSHSSPSPSAENCS